MADLNVVVHELGDKNTDASDLLYAIPTAIFYNLSSKSYTSGIAEFFNAWADNDPHAAQRWLQNMAASIVVAPSRWAVRVEKDGVFTLKGVPAGTYTAFHEVES